MNTIELTKSQYLAAIEMLKEAVTQCPETLWEDQTYKNQFWQVAYHALFYTHLYLQPTSENFVPWAKHREEIQKMQKGTVYSKEEILEYLGICQEQVEEQVSKLELDAPSGFHWLPMNKLEVQFYNIRHLQHHTGELCERLGGTGNIEIPWIGRKPD